MQGMHYAMPGDDRPAGRFDVRAALPYLTAGGLLMLGWKLIQRRRAASFDMSGTRFSPAYAGRGRTIYRNTPSPTGMSGL